MRGLGARSGAVLGVLTLVVCLTTPASAVTERPARPSEAVTAVLVDSYDRCGVTDAWATLNADWSQYGSVPVSIRTGGSLCAGQFTLADLEASGADVVVLSDTAWWFELTPDEVSALQQYADQGHDLLGVGLDFEYHRHFNNILAPLFGLAEQSGWEKGGPGGAAQPLYKIRVKNPTSGTLFRDIPDPYPSSGVAFVQKTRDGQWETSDLVGASFAALNGHRQTAITTFAGSGYEAVYVSSGPWLDSTPADLQFLYNALIYPQNGE